MNAEETNVFNCLSPAPSAAALCTSPLGPYQKKCSARRPLTLVHHPSRRAVVHPSQIDLDDNQLVPEDEDKAHFKEQCGWEEYVEEDSGSGYGGGGDGNDQCGNVHAIR